MMCTFCRILAGELPSSNVLEGERIAAFLDIHPVSEGHTLVVPRRHVESFTELSPEEVSELMRTAQLVATHQKKSLPNCEGVSLSLADGSSAGQEVPHAHLHLIPRAMGDGFGWKFPPNYSTEAAARADLDAVAARLKGALKNSSLL